MKSKFALIILLSGVLLAHGQDSTHTRRTRIRHDKFTAGDIGLRYQLAFNGTLQSQFTVSGFVTKRIEIGGTFTLNVDHIDNSFQGTDSMGSNFQTTNTGWDYTFGFDPFLVGHFPLKGKFDLYLGALGVFQISNIATFNSTYYYPPGAVGPIYPAIGFPTYGTDVQNPVQFTLGLGYIIGCQYFFAKHLALGIQAGEWLGYTFVKGNVYEFKYSITGSGSLNGNTISGKFVANADFGIGAGITLSYYFPAKKKN